MNFFWAVVDPSANVRYKPGVWQRQALPRYFGGDSDDLAPCESRMWDG